jgi:predicted nuclease with TOPRIM domain
MEGLLKEREELQARAGAAQQESERLREEMWRLQMQQQYVLKERTELAQIVDQLVRHLNELQGKLRQPPKRSPFAR